MRATLFVNGQFYTGLHAVKREDSLLSYAEKILFVGPRDQARKRLPNGVPVDEVDLGGRVCVPGFIDSHLHLLNYGMTLRNLQFSQVSSIEQMKDIIREKASKIGQDQWIIGRGWDQDLFREKRYPTRKDLDDAAGGRPCFLTRTCGHVAVASSRALEIAGITAQTPNPPGGVIDKDPYGDPTGILRESAMDLVQSKIPKPDRKVLEESLLEAARDVLSKGITSVHTNDAQGGFQGIIDMYRKVHSENIPLRVYWDLPYEFLDNILETPYRTGSGDLYFKFGAVKIFADGSLGARTAALSEPYSDDPSQKGLLVLPQEELNERVYRAHAAGMQVAIHAIGDEAVRVSLEAINRAQSLISKNNTRHRIVHAQILSPQLITEMKRVGVVVDIQPKFISSDMVWAQDRVGSQRMRSSYAWKTMLRARIPLAGGSDCPVEPPDPLLGIYCAVTRKNMNGEPEGGFFPNEKLSVSDAIGLFTAGAAYASSEETEKGTLEPGKLADFVALSDDPYQVEPDLIKDIKVLMTVVGGHIAYRGQES